MARGFSLTEVIVAMGLLVTIVSGVAPMMMLATTRNLAAKQAVVTSTLATGRMEQIRSLTFAYDANGIPLTDFTTSLASCVSDASGTGLGVSPSNALDADVTGFVDYLDARGACVSGSGSASPPAGAVYTRRWTIVPLETDPGGALVVSVLVTLTAGERARPIGHPRQRRPEDTILIAMRTRGSP